MAACLELAITNIGDLLLRNQITRDAAGNAISAVNLTIPEYQRPYKWTAKNAIQLLDDIAEAQRENRETYRIGTLILHREGKLHHIVDGQQRIITLALLLKAFGTLTIPFLEQPLAGSPFNRRNIPNNYRALERRAASAGEDGSRKALIDYIEDRCELIVIVTENLSEAFQFFDAQNARGKKLYPHDLLKAYHLREMGDLDAAETEKVVKSWEDLDQKELSTLFGEYLYRVREWVKGNKAWELSEQNIDQFKGITRRDNFPYAIFFKGAFAYANSVNHSALPFVSGIRDLKPFQLDTPIVAGKPFFEYAKHYFEILKDIQNNDKYEGNYIRDNPIIKTLNLRKYKNGVGNRITRLLLDTALLLYVDRFCPQRPTREDLEMLDRFVLVAFLWAYSLRAQYYNVGWQAAQNFIMGSSAATVVNSFNLYKIIATADSPALLLNLLSDRIRPIPAASLAAKTDGMEERDEEEVYQNYLHYFKENHFLEGKNES